MNKYDGDGRLTRTSIQYQNGSETFIHYYLNSSVLGLAVSKLTSNGQRQESYVYAGGKKIATASPWQAVWVHEDPVTGSRPDAEFTADGINVGFAEPTQPASEAPDFKYPEVAGSSDCYPGNPNCVACYMDHVEHDCREVSGLLSQGLAKPCPDNDCGPHTAYNPHTKQNELQLVHTDPRTGQLGFWSWDKKYSDYEYTKHVSGGPEADANGNIDVVGVETSVFTWHYAEASFGFLGLEPQKTKTEEHGLTVYRAVDDRRGGSYLNPCANEVFEKLGFGKFIKLDDVRIHIGIPDWITDIAKKAGGITPRAITWGDDIYFRSADDFDFSRENVVDTLAAIGHELEHVMQYNAYGVSFYVKYLKDYAGSGFRYGGKLEEQGQQVEDLLNKSIPQRFGNDPCKDWRH